MFVDHQKVTAAELKQFCKENDIPCDRTKKKMIKQIAKIKTINDIQDYIDDIRDTDDNYNNNNNNNNKNKNNNNNNNDDGDDTSDKEMNDQEKKEYLKSLSRDQLKQILKNNGRHVGGIRADLEKRILSDDRIDVDIFVRQPATRASTYTEQTTTYNEYQDLFFEDMEKKKKREKAKQTYQNQKKKSEHYKRMMQMIVWMSGYLNKGINDESFDEKQLRILNIARKLIIEIHQGYEKCKRIPRIKYGDRYIEHKKTRTEKYNRTKKQIKEIVCTYYIIYESL